MPNLIVTNACELACPFCFASDYRADPAADGPARMNLDELRALLEFVGADTARFCGGEPTLHPDFVEMLSLALARPDGGAMVMTNGLWPAAVQDHVAGLSRRQRARVSYLVNLLEPSCYSDAQRQRLLTTLEVLPARAVTLGFTIHQPRFVYAHLIELARRFGYSQLRYSVAAPSLTDPRTWSIEPERDFAPMAERLFLMVREARAAGIEVNSDCGYLPPCAFSEAQLAELSGGAGSAPTLEFSCHGPIDIGPGGVAWRCFGLYPLVRATCEPFPHAAALGDQLEELTAELELPPLLDACEGCALRASGVCAGGCHAFRAVRDLRDRARACQVQIEDDARLLAAVPSIDTATLRYLKQASDERPLIERGGVWTGLAVTPLEATLLGRCDGARSIARLLDEGGPRGDDEPRRDEIARAARRLFALGAISLRAVD